MILTAFGSGWNTTDTWALATTIQAIVDDSMLNYIPNILAVMIAVLATGFVLRKLSSAGYSNIKKQDKMGIRRDSRGDRASDDYWKPKQGRDY